MKFRSIQITARITIITDKGENAMNLRSLLLALF